MVATVRSSKVPRIDWAQMARDDTWRRKALCRDLDVNIFYPDEDIKGEERNALLMKAKAVCALCPVRAACLEAAMREEQHEDSHRYGVRGGMTASQRKKLRAQHSGKHNYATYTRGCRCDICKAANTAHSQQYRASVA